MMAVGSTVSDRQLISWTYKKPRTWDKHLLWDQTCGAEPWICGVCSSSGYLASEPNGVVGPRLVPAENWRSAAWRPTPLVSDRCWRTAEHCHLITAIVTVPVFFLCNSPVSTPLVVHSRSQAPCG